MRPFARSTRGARPRSSRARSTAMSLGKGGNMVRAVLVASRYAGQPNRLDAHRDALNRKLAGDNIEPRPPAFVRQAGLSAALLNPSAAARMHGASIAIGTLLEPRDDWHVPGAPLPDGSFALLRADESRVELAADSVGSRTLWYALTDHELIASTSQRAIVTLLGSFEPNRDALPWMLSSGTLGPTAGWDARLHRVQPGERVVLDRARWRLESKSEPVAFAADDSASHDCASRALACRRRERLPTLVVRRPQVGADVVRRRGQPQPPVPAARPRHRNRHLGLAGQHRAGRQRRTGRSADRRRARGAASILRDRFAWRRARGRPRAVPRRRRGPRRPDFRLRRRLRRLEDAVRRGIRRRHSRRRGLRLRPRELAPTTRATRRA